MIGSLAGVLTSKSPPHLLIEVGGVGYELEAPMSTFYSLPPVGSPTRLLTHLVVREDAHVLFGFATEEERRLFRHLLKIAGIGPRIGLAILSGMTAAAFAHTVQAQDASALTRIPGVGRRTAERLIVEMRDRLGAEAGGPLPPVSAAGAAAAAGRTAAAQGAEAQAFGALIALGYRPAEATRLLRAGSDQAGAAASTEELIRQALRHAAVNE